METKILFSSFLLLLLAFSASAQMPGNLLDIPSLHSYRIFVYICIYIRMSDLRFLYIRMSDLRFYLPSYCFLACLVGEVQRYPFFFFQVSCVIFITVQDNFFWIFCCQPEEVDTWIEKIFSCLLFVIVNCSVFCSLPLLIIGKIFYCWYLNWV